MKNLQLDQAKLGEFLRDARSMRYMTLSEVASATGFSTSTIGRIENGADGAIDINVLVSLGNVYNLSINNILDFEDNLPLCPTCGQPFPKDEAEE